jgi:hypothetical protein
MRDLILAGLWLVLVALLLTKYEVVFAKDYGLGISGLISALAACFAAAAAWAALEISKRAETFRFLNEKIEVRTLTRRLYDNFCLFNTARFVEYDEQSERLQKLREQLHELERLLHFLSHDNKASLSQITTEMHSLFSDLQLLRIIKGVRKELELKPYFPENQAELAHAKYIKLSSDLLTEVLRIEVLDPVEL